MFFLSEIQVAELSTHAQNEFIPIPSQILYTDGQLYIPKNEKITISMQNVAEIAIGVPVSCHGPYTRFLYFIIGYP